MASRTPLCGSVEDLPEARGSSDDSASPREHSTGSEPNVPLDLVPEAISRTENRRLDGFATVFVIDSDPATCEAVRELASTMNVRCEIYASGHEFLSQYDPALPGCLVLEMRIPGISGLQIQQQLAAAGSILPVIFLTAHATVSIAVRAMRSGAIHVLEKPFREHEMWDAIEEAAELSRRRFELRARQEAREKLLESLSAKDRQLLALIARGGSKKSIALDLDVCLRTVENRRNQLMEKLGISTMTELVRYALAASNGASDHPDHDPSALHHLPR